MILQLKDLNVDFKLNKERIPAVRNVSFYLEEGEMVGLVGESGCGKSVTARAIMQLLPPGIANVTCKKMKIANIDLLQKSRPSQLCGTEVAMIFQNPISALNPTVKVGKQIGECVKKRHPFMKKQEVMERVLELLYLVRLPYPEEHYHQYPFELSGGMCQRICIAMAFAFDPKVIIADEPTTALDVTIQAQILKLMKDLQAQTNTAILFITHDLSIVARYCDRAMVMYAGEIVESAPIDELFYTPKHPYTQLLLKSIPNPNDKEWSLHPIEGQPPKLRGKMEGCPFFDRCPHAMNICKSESPLPHSHSEVHVSRCWLNAKEET